MTDLDRKLEGQLQVHINKVEQTQELDIPNSQFAPTISVLITQLPEIVHSISVRFCYRDDAQ